MADLVARTTRAEAATPGPPAPVSVLYGGAHLFRAGAIEKLGELARRAFEAHVASDDDVCAIVGESARPVASAVRARVAQRLRERPLDDLRVDFEDGYGARSEADEDLDAARVGEALAGYAGARGGNGPSRCSACARRPSTATPEAARRGRSSLCSRAWEREAATCPRASW